MRILVTGSAGFIGSHLCDALLRRGDDVVGIDSFDEFYEAELKEDNMREALDHECFSFVRGDIRDADALYQMSGAFDAVVHLAARAGVRPSIENPELYADVNVMGTARLLRWAEARGVQSFLFASSSSVYGNNEKVPFAEADPVDRPISPYAATKRAGELICHAASHLSGLTVGCLRFFTVYGPRQRPDLAIRKFAGILRNGGRIPMFGDGSSARDYTYVDDTVSGVLGALRWATANPGRYEIFNLGNSQPVRLREMIGLLAEEMGVQPEIQLLPEQAGDVRRTYADITRAREALEYEPSTSLRAGMRRFLKWFEGRPR